MRMRPILLLSFLLLSYLVPGQTYFYIEEIAVVPEDPSTSDNVSIQLIGNFSDSGGHIVQAEASVSNGMVMITLVANSNGGLTVLVPHTETIQLGQLPAGTYTVDLSAESSGVMMMVSPDPFTFTVTGGDPCDHLQLMSMQWEAFGDTMLLVHVLNPMSEPFDYPNFILLDAGGDTLGMETVDLFAIATESWHRLTIADGVIMPEGPFDGRLELWTGFTSELSCVWEQSFELCPPEPCFELAPTLINMGGALTIGTFDWYLWDSDGGEVAGGEFELTDTGQMASADLCLPPGEYSFVVASTSPSFSGQPMFHVTAPGGQSTPMIPVVTSLPMDLLFEFYGPCSSGTNSIGYFDPAPTLITTSPVPGGMVVHHRNGQHLGKVSLYDMQGRLVLETTSNTDQLYIQVDRPGVYLLRAGDHILRFVAGHM